MIAAILGVTGAAGSAIARTVARQRRLDVVGFHRGRHPDAAAAVAEAVADAGRHATLHERDAGTAEAAAVGADAILAEHGPRSVKLFVHAIAAASLGPLVRGDKRITPDRVRRSFESMAHSFVWWTQAMHDRDLLAPSARLLALGNTTNESLIRNTAVITASKAALEAYVRHLAWELGGEGHRVNLLKFGALRSSATEVTFTELGMDHVQATLAKVSPARRTVTAEEVARFVAVLTGDDAAWFNGAVIDFTGGEVLPLFDALVYGREDVTHREETGPELAGDAAGGVRPGDAGPDRP